MQVFVSVLVPTIDLTIMIANEEEKGAIFDSDVIFNFVISNLKLPFLF